MSEKPTWNYILNDLAFSALRDLVISGKANEQDIIDFKHQLKLKDEQYKKVCDMNYEEEKDNLIREQDVIIDKYKREIESLQYDKQLLTNRINKALYRIQLLQMDGEVTIKDLGIIVNRLKGDDKDESVEKE